MLSGWVFEDYAAAAVLGFLSMVFVVVAWKLLVSPKAED